MILTVEELAVNQLRLVSNGIYVIVKTGDQEDRYNRTYMIKSCHLGEWDVRYPGWLVVDDIVSYKGLNYRVFSIRMQFQDTWIIDAQLTAEIIPGDTVQIAPHWLPGPYKLYRDPPAESELYMITFANDDIVPVCRAGKWMDLQPGYIETNDVIKYCGRNYRADKPLVAYRPRKCWEVVAQLTLEDIPEEV